MVPSLQGKKYYSNQQEKYIDYLNAKWTFTQNGIQLQQLFRDSLQERNYSDSTGLVAHENKQGGKLIPEILPEHPLTISLDTHLSTVSVNFFYNKVKLLKEDGVLVWKTIL